MNESPRSNVERKLAYSNNGNADRHAHDVWKHEVGNVKFARVIVVPLRLSWLVQGLQMNQVGVLDEIGNRRTIHHATFSGELQGSPTGGRPVNQKICWDQIPEYHLTDMILQIIRRFVGLREIFLGGRRIKIQTTDVKGLFREVGVDKAGSVTFGYVLGDHGFVDLRLVLGWRGSLER